MYRIVGLHFKGKHQTVRSVIIDIFNLMKIVKINNILAVVGIDFS